MLPRRPFAGTRSRTGSLLVSAALFSSASGVRAEPQSSGPVEQPTGAVLAGDRASEPNRRIVRIAAVHIVGLEQVTEIQVDRVLRGEGLIAGAELSLPKDARVERVKARLRSSGYFRLVNLRVRPLAAPSNAVVLVVELEERPSVTVTDLYAASSLLTPFHGGLQVVERNFLGRGIHLGGGFVWGTLPRLPRARRQQAYRAFGEAPRLGGSRVGVLASAYFVSASEPYRVAGRADDPDPDLFRAFDYSRIGGVLGLTFPVHAGFDIGVDYRFERVDALAPQDPLYVRPDGDTEQVDLDVLDGAHRLTTAHFALSWDGREESVLVGKGGRIALDLQLSSPALGSEYEYVKLVAGGAYTFRLPWRHWITPSLTGGQIAGRAPRFEQFYSGDLSAWTPGREEGLRYSTRNPIDVFGTEIDTREFGVIFGRVDLEYVWPLFRRTRTRAVYGGDLFLSVGLFTIVADPERRRRHEQLDEPVVPLGFNANLGVRLDTPLGVFDLSVGNVLRRVPL